jgi:3',5'-cyclic AMP phosphodiesterase CpdA
LRETNAYAKPLVIGIIGDQTGASNNRPYEIFEEGAKALRQRKPDIVFHVGDIVESQPDRFSCNPTSQVQKYITERFKKGAEILSSIGTPYHLSVCKCKIKHNT